MLFRSFDDQITDDCPDPWIKDLPNKTVNTAILDHMPYTGEWGSYKMSMPPGILDGTPLSFIANLQEKIDMLERSSSQMSMPASVHVPSPGADCVRCKRDPKGVQSLGHKPSDEICPHHAAWRKDREKREANKKKKKSAKGKGKKNKGKQGQAHATEQPAADPQQAQDQAAVGSTSWDTSWYGESGHWDGQCLVALEIKTGSSLSANEMTECQAYWADKSRIDLSRNPT